MNDVKLQESHPIDENLRPLKIGNKSSSLELSQYGNGCRVSGNLWITGSLAGSPLTLDYDNIPASDPSIKGAIWRDGTDLKISSG